MDIFEKIDDEQKTVSRVSSFNIVEKDGRYGFAFVRDESKIDTEYCEFMQSDGSKRCSKEGFWAKKRAKRFYKFLMKPKKEYKSEAKKQKAKQKRMAKIKKLLKKGVNINEYFTGGMDKVLVRNLPAEELRLLYEYGFDLIFTVEQVSDRDCYEKNIYFALEDFDRVGVLRNIPSEILEKVVHTRGGLELSRGVIDNLLNGNYYYGSRALFENLQVLFKTGQVQFTAEQIQELYRSSENYNAKILPELQAAVDLLKIQGKMPDKKYSTQKRTTTQSRRQSNKKSKQEEAQEAIDKLFEDAQNTVE